MTVPPLRERHDLPVLARRIVALEAAGRPLEVGADLVEALQRCRWPGNLRQLAGVLRTAVALCDGTRLSAGLLDGMGLEGADPAAAPVPATGRLQDVQRDAMQQALAAAGGNMTEAARRLGISRNTLYRKLRWADAADAADTPATSE